MEFNVKKYWDSLSKEMQDYISDLCCEIVRLTYERIDEKKRADGLEKKWRIAVDMAARAENERDALMRENSRLHGWLNEAWQKKPRECVWVDAKLAMPQDDGWYIVCIKTLDKDAPLIIQAWFANGKFFLGGLFANHVTHWTPMPSRP